MVWHNITALYNLSSAVTVTDYVSQSTNGVFFEALMVLIFAVMVISLIRYSLESALLTSSFLCFILSLYLTYLNYINFAYTLAFAGIMIFTGLFMYINRQ